MQCSHYDDASCRSCTWLPQAYAVQLEAKAQRAREAVGEAHPVEWLAPIGSAETGFRSKAKMVVSGTQSQPTLGLLDVDLTDCPLYSAAMQGLLRLLERFLARAQVEPYDVARRSGEAKYVLVTESPDAEFMVRFVMRSQEPVARLRKHLPWLLEQAPSVRVATVNVQPEPKAVLEGEREIVLTEANTGADTLPMRLGEVVLHLGPRSFFQTNTTVAAALYRQAAAWVEELVAPASVLDLFCGVGGFALHLTAPGRRVHGVEVSDAAVAAATRSAADLGAAATFAVGDATALGDTDAELVVVNPPRRGLGADLCAALERNAPPWLLYSSCDPTSLATDLARLTSYQPVRAQVLDMFAHTPHFETLVLLRQVPQKV